MARSIALFTGFADSYGPRSQARARPAASRFAKWLARFQRRSVEREITDYLRTNGIDHMTDSIEREIEARFLSRQSERF